MLNAPYVDRVTYDLQDLLAQVRQGGLCCRQGGLFVGWGGLIYPLTGF